MSNVDAGQPETDDDFLNDELEALRVINLAFEIKKSWLQFYVERSTEHVLTGGHYAFIPTS